jgi:large conductance mechanosensitive channel
MIQAFKDFVMRGNVIDMAVGVIIGSAFGTIIKSLVDDVIMPPIGLLLGGVDFSNIFVILKSGSSPKPYASLTAAQEAGAVTMNIGVFINTIISFLIIAFVVFIMIQSFNRLQVAEETPEEEPSTKECPYCISEIPILAVRCPHCTSEL